LGTTEQTRQKTTNRKLRARSDYKRIGEAVESKFIRRDRKTFTSIPPKKKTVFSRGSNGLFAKQEKIYN